MNSTAFADKKSKSEAESKKYSLESIKDTGAGSASEKSSNKRSLLIMTAISAMVVLIAVILISLFIRNNPELVHENDQTAQITENEGYVNPDSIQQLEHDNSNITLKSAPNSMPYIVCGGIFMGVIVVSYIYVKVEEHKEDN